MMTERTDFGTALIAARREKSLSQRQLAQVLGVSQPMVSRWETGFHIPSPERVFQIEHLLGTPSGRLSQHLGYRPT